MVMRFSIPSVVLLAFFASLLFLGTFVFVHAQSLPTNASLQLTPQFPEPQKEVRVSLNAYSVDTTGATISWYVDGVEMKGLRNEREISITTGGLGSSQSVRALVTRGGTTILSLSKEVRPVVLDLVIESNSYVPYFYKGRALPTPSSRIRVVAIPQTGKAGSPSNFTYTWKQNGNVVFGGPILGKQVAEFDLTLFAGNTIEVSVADGTRTVIGKRIITIPRVEPEVHFYTDNPLRGLSGRAVGDDFVMLGDEETIHAEPFFLDYRGSLQSSSFSWQINGAEANPNTDHHTMTLRKVGGEGTARLEVLIQTITKIPQYVRGGFTLFF